jgi:hypothetical protein
MRLRAASVTPFTPFLSSQIVDMSLYIDASSCPIHFNSAQMAMTFSETDTDHILVTANTQMAAMQIR